MNENPVCALEPPLWILVFSRHTKIWWIRLLACGRYKHVKAFAYVPGMDIYLFFDWSLDRAGIVAAPNTAETVNGYLAKFIADADLMAAPQRGRERRIPRFGIFSCVTAVKHLIGVRCPAMRPDGLWRYCIAAGGQPLGRHLWRGFPAAAPGLHPATA